MEISVSDEGTVFNEERVRERIVPTERQYKAGEVRREDVAERVFAALLEEVESWPEVDEIHERAVRLAQRRNRSR